MVSNKRHAKENLHNCLILSLAETRDRALSLSQGSGFCEVIFRCLSHRKYIIVNCYKPCAMSHNLDHLPTKRFLFPEGSCQYLISNEHFHRLLFDDLVRSL